MAMCHILIIPPHNYLSIIVILQSIIHTMYRQTKLVDWCQCCMRGVTFADSYCATIFFRDNNSPQIIHASDNTGCFHIYLSPLRICRGRRLRRPARTPSVNAGRAVVGASPYNNFTNYAVSICKQSGIILADLLFQIAVI
jgi:hypothetical protein